MKPMYKITPLTTTLLLYLFHTYYWIQLNALEIPFPSLSMSQKRYLFVSTKKINLMSFPYF